MEIKDFIQNFINEIEPTPTEQEIELITENSDFRNFEGWDSLTALCIQVMIENTYGVTITNSEIREAKTFNDIFQIIKRKKG